MTIEVEVGAGLAAEQRRSGKNSNRVKGKVIRKKKCYKRRSETTVRMSTTKRCDAMRPLGMPQQPPVRALQRLYESCRGVFKGPGGSVPSPADVQNLCHILDGMLPEDVELNKEMEFFNPKSEVEVNPRVKYTTIYKCDNFSLCIFFLPATAVIPLHNHPEMTVFSKLLLGKMHIKSYDWVDPVNMDESVPRPKLRLARLKANSVFTAPCNTSVLYPTTGGNIHAFTGMTPCAVLDVMGPPYSKMDGRDCSYYKETPHAALSNGGTSNSVEDNESYGWLEEIEMPKESEMDGIAYMGPQVIETSS